MVALSSLWLPILISAVLVFIASTFFWMAPFWHRKDYDQAGDDTALVSALSVMRSGMYMVPSMNWEKATPEERAACMKGPTALVLLRNPGSTFSFPGAMGSYFLYCLLMSTLIGYLASISLPAGAHYMQVFRVVSTAGVLAFSFGMIPDSIWYGRPWRASIKGIIDGVIIGLLMAGVFGWLWPN